MSRPVVVLVAKRTSWTSYVDRAQDPLVLDLLRRNDPSVGRMRAAHEAHEACLAVVEAALARADVEVRRVDDPTRPFPVDGADLLMTVGGDGTLLIASHKADHVPVLGVNSAPGFSVGFFCGADASSFESVFDRFLAGRLAGVTLSRMEVSRNGQLVSRRVLNDALLCHTCPAATSRYLLSLGDLTEEQRSSGLWVGPAAGSTAAQRSAGGDVLPLDSDLLQVVVREPYLPEDRPLALTKATFTSQQTLTVRSKMYDAALFFDGPGNRAPVTIGDVIEFRHSPEPLRLLGLHADRRRAGA